jgi:hypothetical protein
MTGDPDDFDDDINAEPAGPATQIGLVCAILGYLAKTDDCANANTRQQNAVIAAANEIMRELGSPHRPATPGMGLPAWRVCDDRGMSSNYLAAVLDGVATRWVYSVPHEVNFPHDPSDFGRCVRMLDACPGFRELLPAAMADPRHGPAWNALASEWADLEAMYAAALPSGDAQALWDAMKACGC